MTRFLAFLAEDAPANAAGNGGVAGIGVGDKGEPGVHLKKRQRTADDVRVFHTSLKRALGQDTVEESHTIEPAITRNTFAGATVFEVSGDVMHRARFGKNRYHTYARYVGDDETGEAIRQHGRQGHDVILQDSTTAVMTYLRRRKSLLR